MNKQKGFTIIELIVVIAIIAVLAAIVLVNVTSYIAKGKDSSIKGNMASMVTMDAAFYDENGTHVGLSANAAYASGVTAIDSANGVSGTVLDEMTATAWCLESDLNDGSDWCVDNTGYKGGTADCDAGTADCAPDA